MDPAAVAHRARLSREMAWDRREVLAAIRTAWAARPRTVEHTSIMAWATLALPTRSEHRLAVHMTGLNAQDPYAYPITRLVRERLRWSWGKYIRVLDDACDKIASDLNEPGSLLTTKTCLVDA